MIESLESRIAPATFTVITLADSGAGSLRDAVAGANDTPGADLIVFKKGLAGAIELTTGQIDITDTLSIKGPGASKLAISGEGASRIFQAFEFQKEFSVAFSGLAFLNAKGPEFSDEGGAIFSTEALKVANCVFKDCTAPRQGGAIAFVEDGSGAPVDVVIKNSAFIGNSNTSFGGGAVLVETSGNALIKGCTFSGNSSDTRAGALALEIGDGGVGRLEGCVFIGNSAPEHGALNGSLGGGKLIIVGNTFTGNRATEGLGGAIAIFGNGETTFDRNIVSQNTSFTVGGGMTIGQFTSLIISNSRFLDNTAELSGFVNGGGGGISIGADQPPGSTAKIINTIISGNSSTKGGGIYVEDDPFSLKFIGSKIVGNRSGTEGGGIYIEAGSPDLGASVELMKTTVSGNVAANLGGGVYSSGKGSFKVNSSKIVQNDAAGGGGFYLAGSTPVEISNSLFAQNHTLGAGGGIAAFVAVDVDRTRFVGNSAAQFGGAIYSTARLDVANSLISGNFALFGGGIFQQSADILSLLHTKVIGNVSNDGKEVADM